MHRFTQLVSCLIDQLLTDLLQGLQSTPGHNPYSDAAAQTGCFRFAQEVCTTMQHTHSEPFVTSLSVHCSLLFSRRHTHTHTRTHACTLARMHARTHARTHTHIHRAYAGQGCSWLPETLHVAQPGYDTHPEQ